MADIFGRDKSSFSEVVGPDDSSRLPEGVLIAEQSAVLFRRDAPADATIETIARVCHASEDKLICTHNVEIEPKVSPVGPIDPQVQSELEKRGVKFVAEMELAPVCPECAARRKTFLKALAARGHHSVFEHVSATFLITTSRGISHEIVRHRLASYTQQSTRYVPMDKRMFVIEPYGIVRGMPEWNEWKESVQEAHRHYKVLVANGVKPEVARDVLPNCLTTKLYMTANAREWRESFVRLRGHAAAHPHMRELTRLIYGGLMRWFPTYFEDCEVAND